jgi:hypothetical protein
MRLPIKGTRILAPVALSLLLGGSAYAFMATNNVNNSSAGVGTGAISGYYVTNIQYGLSGQDGNPASITSVSFELSPQDSTDPATQVAVWFDNNPSNVASTALQTCMPNTAVTVQAPTTAWTCTINWTQPAGQSPNSTVLDVAATGQGQ